MRQGLTRLICLLLCIAAATVRAGEFAVEPLPFGDFPTSSALPFPALTASPDEPLLRARLIPGNSAIAPGVPFTLALQLEHQKGTYSYWTNPGGPGLATSVAWSLPEGFTISSPHWPTPEVYRNAGMVFYIHKNQATLVYTVTPPQTLRQGVPVTISGIVDTQVCTPRTCTPLRESVQATLRVAGTPGPVAAPVAAAVARLPAPPAAWRLEATDGKGEISLRLTPEKGSNADPGNVYFFDNAVVPVVDSQRAQVFAKAEDGGYRLRLPRNPGSAAAGGMLTGVLTAENGWLAGGATVPAFQAAIPVAAAGVPSEGGLTTAAGEHVGVVLVFAFLGGLLLNIMPCVFPVIGLKIMGFAKQAHKERRAVVLHGLAYTAGVLLCFWALSFLVITMGRGWGAQLQADWFMLILCHLFLIMSMNMAGVFDVGTSVSAVGQELTHRVGLKRSFFTGLLATLTSTPCSAPFLGTALAYALSLTPLLSLGVFTLMGLGFAFPYLALSLFPGWLKALPKPGPWMDTFRVAMCFPLFATTCYLFWTMEGMVDELGFLLLLFGLVLTAMACWMYGKYQHGALRKARTAKVWLGCGVAALAVGVWAGWPRGAAGVAWQEWSPEEVARLRAEGKAVYVDFTARWCATCQVNKRVYLDAGLQALLLEKGVVLLKADWTKRDERITATLRNEFNKAAVPVNVLYVPGKAEGDLLPELLTVENVGERLRALP